MKDETQNDDIQYDAEAEETGGDGAQELAEKIKKLKKELKECQAEKAEYLAGWQRAKADYLNLKKDETEKRESLSRYAKADVLNDLINLADSFDLAFANKEAWESVPENWRKGVEYIHSQLLVVFRDHGLEELNPLGESFDPARDESIGIIPTQNKKDDDKVLEVVKKGYRLNEKVIRAAQVKIGQLEEN